MPAALPFDIPSVLSGLDTRCRDQPTIKNYEFELSEHRREETRLRQALAQAESLLREWEHPYPERSTEQFEQRDEADSRVASLTPRELEIMELVLAGHPSKNIAADLGISRRTVENHRAAIMKKTGSASLPALGRFGLTFSRSESKQRAFKANRRRSRLPSFDNTIITSRV